MIETLRKWLRKERAEIFPRARSIAWIPKPEIPTAPRSRPFPTDLGLERAFLSRPISPAIPDPRVLFPLLRQLRDYIPDVSAGVWAWVRLCSTLLTYTFTEGNSEEQERARRLLIHLDHRISGVQGEREKGIDSLMQNFFLSVFTYGAFCGEVVLDDSGRQIDRFIIIDPATIRFQLHPVTRAFLPYQILADDSRVELNPASFFYFGLDTDGLAPYGRSPLLSLPFVVKLQQQLIGDMARAQHNAGYPTVHFRITTPERQSREPISEYNKRLQEELDGVRHELSGKKTDSNLVTFNNVEVHYIGPNGNAQQWSESIQAISEQVVSALHLAPFMIGRNWGTTESWGTAQYQLLTNNARTVQEGAKRLADWLRNLELILQGSPLMVTHQFAPHHNFDVYDRARALQTGVQTLITLSEKGLLDEANTRQRIESLLRFLH